MKIQTCQNFHYDYFCRTDAVIKHSGILASRGQPPAPAAIRGCFHQRFSMVCHEWQGFTVIDGDWRWLMTIDNEWQWLTTNLYHDWPRTIPILLVITTNGCIWRWLLRIGGESQRLTKIYDGWRWLAAFGGDWRRFTKPCDKKCIWKKMMFEIY